MESHNTIIIFLYDVSQETYYICITPNCIVTLQYIIDSCPHIVFVISHMFSDSYKAYRRLISSMKSYVLYKNSMGNWYSIPQSVVAYYADLYVSEMDNTNKIVEQHIQRYISEVGCISPSVLSIINKKIYGSRSFSIKHFRKTTTYKTIRLFCLNRDGHRCKACKTHRNLTIHHIVPLSENGEHVPSNIITLCNKCHVKVHKGYNIQWN